jgi:hypothetical protein
MVHYRSVLSGRIQKAPSGAKGFDTDVPISLALAKKFKFVAWDITTQNLISIKENYQYLSTVLSKFG